MPTATPKVREGLIQENSLSNTGQEQEYRALFQSLPLVDGKLPILHLLKLLNDAGIHSDDPRINLSGKPDQQDRLEALTALRSLDFEEFKEALQASQGSIIKDAILGNLVLPDFQSFKADLESIFKETKKITEGKVATYIPQLGRVDPKNFGFSLCTIDGQRFSMGDSNTPFCIQSISKPVTYCLALEQFGEEMVHHHVGREPSGIGFNGLVLNSMGLPHNPMINSGSIMCCSMVRPDVDVADRFDYVLDTWTRLSGGTRAGFNNSVYLSERQTADRNFALGYFMRENNAFPPDTDLITTLEFYFQCCSIEVTTKALGIVAATLANGGICPTTGERIFHPNTVKNCLSLMSSCGMYDFSGEFAFSIGLPAKSGVAGGLMVVVPNLLGFAIWSPALDNLGNSVRGLDFCKKLVSQYNFHVFDSLVGSDNQKKDPRQKRNQSRIDGIISLCWAASEGDLKEIQRLVARGVDINQADYDGRTAMHLAAREGHAAVIEYLFSRGAVLNPIDRWGNSPLDDALKAGHAEVIALIEGHAK
jgi:glutaminase